MKKAFLTVLFGALVLAVLVGCSSNGSGGGGGNGGGSSSVELGTDTSDSVSDTEPDLITFTTEGSGDYVITLSDFSADSDLDWYLFEDESDANAYVSALNDLYANPQNANLQAVFDAALTSIAVGDDITDPEVGTATALASNSVYFLVVEDVNQVGSSYTLNISAAGS